jgi:hypothetical protein
MHHRRRGVTAPGRRLPRHRIRRPSRRPRRHRPRRITPGITPVRPHRLVSELDPRAEIPGPRPGRLIPANSDRPQEPPPPQHGQPIGPVRRRRPAARGQLTKVHSHRDEHRSVCVDQPVRLEQVPGRLKRPAYWHRQPRQVPRRISFCDHGRDRSHQESHRRCCIKGFHDHHTVGFPVLRRTGLVGGCADQPLGPLPRHAAGRRACGSKKIYGS